MDNPQIDVSVIIPSKNVSKIIIEQLEALEKQENPPKFEVIVSNNGSTDNTVEVVNSYQASYPLRIVDSSAKAGISFARNEAVRHAFGEAVFFCDADDIVRPQWIRNLYDAYKSSEKGLVSGFLRHEEYNTSDIIYAYEAFDSNTQPDITAPPIPGESTFLNVFPNVVGCNFGSNRDLYISVGGMDESFIGGSEETEFAWRAVKSGASYYQAPGAIVDYRLRNTTKSIFRQQRLMNKSRVLLWARYKENGMIGVSLKYSITAVLTNAIIFATTKKRAKRLRAVRHIAGNIGALQGMWLYRFSGKKIPNPELMNMQ